MTLIKQDHTRNLFTWPKWIDDIDLSFSNRGLKIRETEKEIHIEAVVAGVPSKDVEVHIEDGVLTIKAEANKEESEHNEYKSSSYQYYYTTALSGGQWDKTKAKVKDGVVAISIPKTEAAKPRKIAIQTE